MKPMDFEEWKKKPEAFTTRDVWIAARIGMIPEDEALRMPDWQSVNAEVNRLDVYAYDQKGCQYEKLGSFVRPVPAWTPKVGEAVFVSFNGKQNTYVGLYKGFTESHAYGVLSNGTGFEISFENLKPFHESHIGKPWDEIPGGGK